MRNEKTEEPIITRTETEDLAMRGYDIDEQGRPVHPNSELLDTSAPNGKGAFYNWGPNYTADPIVITTEARPQVLLIHRNDTGDLALPGGFIDAKEQGAPITAAIRELEEETGLVLTTEGTLVYQGVVKDPRATLNAWPETSAYLFKVSAPLPVKAGDDAHEAGWHFIDELPETVYGSHTLLIEKAMVTLLAPEV